MKILFIGGTGNISASVDTSGHEMFHLNRGNNAVPKGVTSLVADIHNPEQVKATLKGHRFDAVVNWIAFIPADVQRDSEIFREITDQYIFISSASCYQKPPRTHFITEKTPLENPYWQYSREKIAAEAHLRTLDMPFTIVRPSLTYGNVFPVPLHGWGCYTLVDRLLSGREIIVHGDGTSLWTVTHAEDFGRGLMGLIGNPSAMGEDFHITSDEVLTWNQIYETISQAVGVSAKLVHIPSDFIIEQEPSMLGGLLGDKSHSVVFDNSKVKRSVPSFEAKISFKEGVKRVLDEFERNPERKIVNPDVHTTLDRVLAAYRR